MNTLKECFDAIMHGDKTESRNAARRVRKLLYSSQGDREKYKDIKWLVTDAPSQYAKISDVWRQENFVLAISVIYYLHGRDEKPDVLFPWLFQLLQHPNGYIRHAAVRMLRNEIWPLTVHIRIPGYKPECFDRVKPEHAERILRSLVDSLHGLLSVLWKPEYERCKYIDSIPASPYKSVQMVLAEIEESCEEMDGRDF